jgi:hypothetical protein
MASIPGNGDGQPTEPELLEELAELDDDDAVVTVLLAELDAGVPRTPPVPTEPPEPDAGSTTTLPPHATRLATAAPTKQARMLAS